MILRAFQWRQALRHGKPARRWFFYAGLAGTGKTHIVLFLVEELGFRNPFSPLREAGLCNGVSFDVEIAAPVQADRLVQGWDAELRVTKRAERREQLELLSRSSDADADLFEKLRLVRLVETGGEHRAEGVLHTRRILEGEALADKKAISAGLLRRDARVAAALGAIEASWGYAATVHKA